MTRAGLALPATSTTWRQAIMDSLSLHDIVLGGFVALLCAAAVGDFLWLLIPNRLVAAVALLYPAHVLVSPMPPDWTGALMVAATAYTAGAAAFALGWVGGGDVKLFAAVALWAGPAHILTLLFVTAIAGGLVALLSLGSAPPALTYAFTRSGAGHARDRLADGQIPYGAAIAAGGAFIVLRFLAA